MQNSETKGYMDTFIHCNNLKIRYEIKGKGTPLVFLHGWGGELNSWFPITEELQDNFQTITLDLPGFGESEPPSKVWGIPEYAQFLDDFLNKLEIENFVLIGHSFGGTIATQYAFLYPNNLNKLILVDAKIIKPQATIKQKGYQFVAKSGKIATSLLGKRIQSKLRKKLYHTIGEHDYEETDGIMKEIFKTVIQYDYTEIATHVKNSTLIIWGGKDQATPISDAHTLKEIIPNANLEIITGDHFAYLENPQEFCKIVKDFI